MPPMHPFMTGAKVKPLSWQKQKELLKAFVHYYKGHRKLLLLSVTAAVLVPVFTSLSPILILKTLQEFLPAKNTEMIFFATSGFALLLFGSICCDYICMRFGKTLGCRMERDMRHDLLEHLQKLSFSYFDKQKTGEIMSRITNDLTMISTLAHRLPEGILSGVLRFLLGLTIMTCINWRLACFALLPAPLILFWLTFWQGKLRNAFGTVRKDVASLNINANNTIKGIRETQSYTGESRQLKRFDAVNDTLLSGQELLNKFLAFFHTGMGLMLHGYSRLFIAIGIVLVCFGMADVTELLVFFMYSHSISMPVMMLTDLFEQYQQAMAAFERFHNIVTTAPEITDKPSAMDSLPLLRGEVELRNVCFHYEDPDPGKPVREVLKGINMRIPAGSKVAIVGESGAGKSTLGKLLMRFYEVTEGSILLDGRDIRDYKLSFLRKQIGTVSQSSFLFDTTLKENIAFGKDSATDEEICTAARFASIADFIDSLPEKYETQCGENGILLSGGQHQRIAIARAFLKDPPVLILDEATSSLDNESEAHIQRSLEKLSEKRTTITIAHRLSTVIHADCIYCLKDGVIAEQGRHEELLARNGVYAALYNSTLKKTGK